jgi:hypothetical protein
MTISSKPKDKTKIWKLKTGFGNIEMMTAEYYTQSFAKHSHNDFPFSAVFLSSMILDEQLYTQHYISLFLIIIAIKTSITQNI